ncbi:class I SAM-dependent methyltransferase [Metallumcola ferriviriculae]|uniref:Class I SAM-dependent methyltransferase n=1 Tax=Metallumcola ferriviriculae TaxID=3039180 RepID=A0AAU0ULD4_9FIRM|nr:class I SAM-dependent methyltransferase [Desulfitibacteraceae bacterium MK1]
MDQIHTDSVRRKYNRVALIYDLMESPMEMHKFDKHRRMVWSHARGKTLEVGVGTGKNIPYYPDNTSVTGIDFSERMLAKAVKRKEKLHHPVELRLMDAQRMDFPDNSFDTVVSTCVFCTVPDPILGLREIKRVCKPAGQVLMLEHVRSCRPLLGPLMDIINPVVRSLIGTNINRDTQNNIRQAGLQIKSVTPLWSDILFLIEALPGK